MLLQIPAKHLVTASILSAPAAVMAAKMMVPETRPKSNQDDKLKFENS